MEEQKEDTTQPVSKPKKVVKKKSALDDAQKVAEAKKKVNELLKGTGLEEPEDDSVFIKPNEYGTLVQMHEEKGNNWMQKQMNDLHHQIERLENENMNLKNGQHNIESNISIESGSEKQKIIELYKHFEGVYTGRNKYNTPFGNIALSNPQHGNGVLDLLLTIFPFLVDIKSYKHRG